MLIHRKTGHCLSTQFSALRTIGGYTATKPFQWRNVVLNSTACLRSIASQWKHKGESACQSLCQSYHCSRKIPLEIEVRVYVVGAAGHSKLLALPQDDITFLGKCDCWRQLWHWMERSKAALLGLVDHDYWAHLHGDTSNTLAYYPAAFLLTRKLYANNYHLGPQDYLHGMYGPKSTKKIELNVAPPSVISSQLHCIGSYDTNIKTKHSYCFECVSCC